MPGWRGPQGFFFTSLRCNRCWARSFSPWPYKWPLATVQLCTAKTARHRLTVSRSLLGSGTRVFIDCIINAMQNDHTDHQPMTFKTLRAWWPQNLQKQKKRDKQVSGRIQSRRFEQLFPVSQPSPLWQCSRESASLSFEAQDLIGKVFEYVYNHRGNPKLFISYNLPWTELWWIWEAVYALWKWHELQYLLLWPSQSFPRWTKPNALWWFNYWIWVCNSLFSSYES